MRKFAFLFFGLSLLSACNNTTNQAEEKTETAMDNVSIDYQYYGDSITPDNAIPAEELLVKMQGTDSIPVKVKGTIKESCKMKGCWMNMDLGNGKEMRISFKDYGFFVPKNLEGETAIIDGYAIVDTTDVDMLRHLAHDAGKSEEEINAITEPEVGISYVANGVIIEPKS